MRLHGTGLGGGLRVFLGGEKGCGYERERLFAVRSVSGNTSLMCQVTLDMSVR